MKNTKSGTRRRANPAARSSPDWTWDYNLAVLWTCAIGALAAFQMPTGLSMAFTVYTTVCLGATIGLHGLWKLLNTHKVHEDARAFSNTVYYVFLAGTALCAIGLAVALGRGL